MYEVHRVWGPVDAEVAQLAARVGNRPEAVVEVLREVQSRRGRLSRETVAEVARALGLPASKVYGVATFYAMLTTPAPPERTIRICDGPYCALRGAGQLRPALQARFSSWTITRTSCLGLCDRAPAVLVREEQVGPVLPDRLDDLAVGWCGETTDYRRPRPGEVRVLLPSGEEAGDSAREMPGLERALRMTREEVLAVLEASGLRGRGGAGFPAGRKWRLVAAEPRVPKYVVCNADESEPLSFKDRVLLDLRPERVLEGMAIVAYAIGAEEGFLYIRGEYAGQEHRVEEALAAIRQAGWFSREASGGSFRFTVHVHRGAGAYVCGEETALLESLEGHRGEPRPRPPFPTTWGLNGQPTAVSNVETLAYVPHIVARGAAWYRSLGDPKTPGTKLYTLVGDVNRGGLFEAPYGLTLRQMIDKFCGGMRAGSAFRCALTGGAAGTLVGPEQLDVPIDYDSIRQGVALGSGGFLVCDQTVSPVKLLREVLHFFESESCGKCTPCRIGTRDAREILDRMVAGRPQPGDRRRLERLADLLQRASLCGLGTSVANPIRSALARFPECFPEA